MRKCGICKEVYNSRERTPRFLQTCGHTFCERCLQRVFKNGIITCPLDRTVCQVGLEGVEQLPLNLSLLERTNDVNGDDAAPVVPLSLWIPPEKLELGAKLGEGAFGEVRTAWLEEAGRRVPVAVKCLFHSSLSSLRVQKDGAVVQSAADAAFAKEMEMLFFASKHCAFVCQLIGICRKSGKVCIVMKKYKHSIRDLMRKQGGKLELKQLLRYGAHICRAMAELHKMGVLMRDLKPANFLIDDYDFAVVADFGLSKFLNSSGASSGPGSTNGEAAGTPNYMAPEAWTGECLVKETDVWSFACSVITMMAGEPPWDDIVDTKVIKARVVQQRVKPTLPEGLPLQVSRVLNRCFSYDWQSRPSFDDLLDVFQSAKDTLDLKRLVVCHSSPSIDSPVCVLSHDFDEGDKCCGHSGSISDRCLPGSWVKLKSSGNGRDWPQEDASVINAVSGMVGVVRHVHPNGRVTVDYSLLESPLTFLTDDLEVVPSLRVGDSVRVKDSVTTPRLGWGDAVTHQTIGMVSGIDDDVSSVTVVFPGAQTCVGCKVDPSELELVARPFRKKDWVRVKAAAFPALGDWRDIKETSIGVVQSIKDGKLAVAFCSRTQPLIVDPLMMEAVFPPPFHMNDSVRVKLSVSRPTFDWGRESHRSIGPIIRIRENGLLEVQFHHRPDIWMADPADMEIVFPSRPFQKGDWAAVRRYVEEPKFRWGDVSRNSTGIVSGVRPDGTLEVGFCYMAKPWLGDPSEMALYQPPPFRVGDRVKVKMSVKEPRFKWAGQGHTSVGTIAKIGEKGLLEVKFVNRKEYWYADPAEMIVVPPPVFKKGSWVRPNAAAYSRRHLPSWDGVSVSSLGIVQSIEGDVLSIAFCARSTPLVVKRDEMDAVDPPPFKIGDIVVRREMQQEPNHRLPGSPDSTSSADKSGPIINIRDNGALEVQVWHRSDILVADPADMKVLHPARPFRKGDWTGMKRIIQERLKWGPLKRSSLGIVRSVLEDGMLEVNFCCDETRPLCLNASDMALYCPPPFQVGDCVKVKRSVIQPTFKWGGETHRSVGPVIKIRRNGILEIQFADRSDIWIGDPGDMEVVHRARPFQKGDWTSVKRTVKMPKYKWGLADVASLGRVSEVLADGGLLVDFCFCKRWFADPTDMVLYIPPPFQIGDGVKVKRSVDTPRCGWGGEPRWRVGTVVKIRDDGTLEVQFSHRSDLWLADPADMFVYRAARPFRTGDWVGIKRGASDLSFPWGEEEKASIGIVSSLLEAGAVEVVFCYSSRKWIANPNDLVLYDPPPFNINDSVKVKASVKIPRFGWEDITHQSVGTVARIRDNGVLEVQFPSRSALWLADPSDMIVRREPHVSSK